jgi:hypothetical protein
MNLGVVTDAETFSGPGPSKIGNELQTIELKLGYLPATERTDKAVTRDFVPRLRKCAKE